jgi:hypothetical protein
MDKPIKQNIQDLTHDTVKNVTHLDSTIHMALSHKKISQIKHNKHLDKRLLNIIKENHRKLIIIIIITKADKVEL